MFGRNKKVRGTTPSPKSNQNNPNYVRIILALQSYYKKVKCGKI